MVHDALDADLWSPRSSSFTTRCPWPMRKA